MDLASTWSVFAANLNFENTVEHGHDVTVEASAEVPARDGFREWVDAVALWERGNSSGNVQDADAGVRYDDWLMEKKVKVKDTSWNEGLDVGDSCCFGTRTVEVGKDCVWKLHGTV